MNAATVIAAINTRRPGLSVVKRDLLLFFAQGHQLAHGSLLFGEDLFATADGVRLGEMSGPAATLTPGQLNTVADVVNRYGDLKPADLRTLVQASTPWQKAVTASLGSRIEPVWLQEWFRRPDETEDAGDDRPTQSAIAAWRARGREVLV